MRSGKGIPLPEEQRKRIGVFVGCFWLRCLPLIYLFSFCHPLTGSTRTYPPPLSLQEELRSNLAYDLTRRM